MLQYSSRYFKPAARPGARLPPRQWCSSAMRMMIGIGTPSRYRRIDRPMILSFHCCFEFKLVRDHSSRFRPAIDRPRSLRGSRRTLR
jgi:hypothetical protein